MGSCPSVTSLRSDAGRRRAGAVHARRIRENCDERSRDSVRHDLRPRAAGRISCLDGIHRAERGVEGWVRNRRDGTVEAVFAGPAEAVSAMIEACRGGPPGARVEALDARVGNAQDLAPRRAGELFSMLPTV